MSFVRTLKHVNGLFLFGILTILLIIVVIVFSVFLTFTNQDITYALRGLIALVFLELGVRWIRQSFFKNNRLRIYQRIHLDIMKHFSFRLQANKILLDSTPSDLFVLDESITAIGKPSKFHRFLYTPKNSFQKGELFKKLFYSEEVIHVSKINLDEKDFNELNFYINVSSKIKYSRKRNQPNMASYLLFCSSFEDYQRRALLFYENGVSLKKVFFINDLATNYDDISEFLPFPEEWLAKIAVSV